MTVRVEHSLQAARAGVAAGGYISIGNFDGVHLGHRGLLAQAKALAQRAGAPFTVVTFFPPTRTYFTSENYLSSESEKLELLTSLAPDLTVMVPFDQEYATVSKDEFAAGLGLLKPAGFVVGADFRFGKGREGTLADLRRVAPVTVADVVSADGQRVASSRIRKLLAAGEVLEANTLLGAPYFARGTVILGERRGHQLGFPTANLTLPKGKALPLGVFAVRVSVLGQELGGMANVGARPTFPENAPPLEVHLFNFSSEIYGEEITVHFIAKLREQKRFGSLEELREQLGRDASAARAALAGT